MECLSKNEVGDAELLAKVVEGKFCYDHNEGCWYRYNGNIWIKDTTNQVMKVVDEVVGIYKKESSRQASLKRQAITLDDISARKLQELETELKELPKRYERLNTLQRRKNIVTLASGGSLLGISGKDEWDKNPMVLPCANGIIDLESGQLIDSSPDNYIKSASPVIWDGLETVSPVFDKSLDDIFGGDQDLIEYVKRLLGMALIGEVREHVLPIFWGKGRNGKSTVFDVLQFVLGSLMNPIPAETLLSQKNTQSGASHNADIFLMKGRRLVYCSELTSNRYFEPSVIKRLTGGDSITARKPHATDFETFTPSHTICILTNDKPKIQNADDYAMFQRLHLIPFNLSFVADPKEEFERKADTGLKKKLEAEASGILATLVRGCLSYQEMGLCPPEVVLEATKAYQSEEDIIGHFIDDSCVDEAGSRINKLELYKCYQEWCQENGHHHMNSTNFYKKIKEKYKEGKSGNNRYFEGIALQRESKGNVFQSESKGDEDNDDF